jgi:methylthioribose-1-phosphate isomerase
MIVPDIPYSPAFDIPPPHLVSAVITPKGVLPPQNMKAYFEEEPGKG